MGNIYEAIYCSDNKAHETTKVLNDKLKEGFKIVLSFRVDETGETHAGWRYIIEKMS